MIRRPSKGTGGRCLCALSLGLSLGVLGGCSSGDPLVAKAERACLQQIEQDPDYQGPAQYALDVAARSPSPFSRQLLLESLHSDHRKKALDAVRGFADHPDPGAEGALREVFTAGSRPLLQLEAALGLARLGDAEALSWLKENLDQFSGSTRLKVLVFLGRQGEKDLVLPVVGKLIGSESQDVRDEAYGVLGEIGQPWATKVLLEGFEQEHGAGREKAIVALGRAGDASVAPKLARFVNTRGLVFATIEALGQLGNKEAKPALEKMLKSREDRVKVYAGTALWKLGELENPQELLGPLVNDEDFRVRLSLAEQLAGVQEEDALGILMVLTEDEDAAVREAAVRALAEQQNPGTIHALKPLVEDPAYAVASVALGALGRMADAEVAQELEPLLVNQNPYVVISAAGAILEIKARGQSSEAEG